jgi:hypothetical protein
VSGPQRERVLVNVGCGPRHASTLPRYFDHWRQLRVDVDASVQPDILADLTDLSPIPDGSADDGFVCVIVPDLQTIAQYVAADRLHETLYDSPAGPVTPHDIVFGFGVAIASGRTSMAHRCGFTPGMLQRCFNELPYGEVLLRRRSTEYELAAVARAIPARDDAERAALMSALEL